MIRSVLLVTLGTAITVFLSFECVIFSFFSNAANNIHKTANLWAKILLFICDIKVQIIGRENILRGKPQIFMANNQSDFDILIVLANIPGQFRWLVKKELFQIPIFGSAMKGAGYIEIDINDKEKAMQSLNQAALRLREGKSIMAFPEGTRSRQGEIKSFKQGTFYLAINSGVPIVPISIVGSGEIMPKRSLKIKSGRIKLIIGKPIDATNFPLENRQELIAIVRNTIIKNYDSFRAEGDKGIRDLEKDIRH
ncbi:MAG: lysophospholipid acyltransferase family protein [Deltaproteobacteria bacterium]